MLHDGLPFIPITLSSESQPVLQGFVTASMDKYQISVDLGSGQRLWIKLQNPTLRLTHLAESKSKGPVVSVIKHDIIAQGKAQILEPGGGVSWIEDFRVTIMSDALLKMADPYRAPSDCLEGRWTGLNLLDQSITIAR
jgi:hypothetical protein